MASTSGGGGAVNKVERAHHLYREGRYDEALGFYTEALSVAKTKSQRIALHSNRAACFLKLHHFKKAAEECASVLELDHDHSGALMLRAQTLVTLKEYNSALFDVNRLIELNPQSEVYQNLQTRLRTQLSLAPIPEEEAAELEEEDDLDAELLEDEKIEEEVEGGVNDEEDKVVNEHGVKAERVGPATEPTTQSLTSDKPIVQKSSGWQQIPKPKGHSQLDYSRWDRVDDDTDEDDEDEDSESRSQYRFRVRNIGVRAVK